MEQGTERVYHYHVLYTSILRVSTAFIYSFFGAGSDCVPRPAQMWCLVLYDPPGPSLSVSLSVSLPGDVCCVLLEEAC